MADEKQRQRTKPPSTIAVVNAMISAMDIEKLVGFPFEWTQTDQAVSDVKGDIPVYLDSYFKNWDLWASQSAESNIAMFQGYLKEIVKDRADYTAFVGRKAQVSGTAAAIWKMAYDLETQLRGFDVFHDALINLPQDKVSLRFERYWNKRIGLGRPDSFEAFLMYRKGLVSQQLVIDTLQEDEGFSGTLAQAALSHYYYDPSIYDTWRLVSVYPVSREWLRKKLTNLGLTDEDIDLFVEAGMRQTSKDEITKMLTLIQSDYQFGINDESTLGDLLFALRLSADEIMIQKQICNDLRDTAILKTLTQRDIYYFQKKPMTPEWLFNQLITAQPQGRGLDFFVADAMVSEEMAKQGIWWTAPEENYALTVTPDHDTCHQGDTVDCVIGIIPSYGWSATVTLSQTGADPSMTVSFTPDHGTPPFDSVMEIATAGGTPVGTYIITVKGTSGTTEETVIYTLTITA
jgi:hypothetical protein